MPVLSVLTSLYAPSADFLDETAASVRGLELPPGWKLEWILQEDGDHPRLSSKFDALSWAKYEANGRQLGLAPTRNLALSRARGVLAQNLDQDDILLPGALATLLPHFRAHRIHWAIGQADDLLPDGTRRGFPTPIGFGLIPPGAVNEWAIQHDGNWPIHTSGLLMRTDSLRAVGGWAGIPHDDDIAMFAGLSQVGAGYYDQATTWLYRMHPKQIHRTGTSQNLSERGRRFALQRVAAAKATQASFSESAAAGFDSDTYEVHVGPAMKDTAL